MKICSIIFFLFLFQGHAGAQNLVVPTDQDLLFFVNGVGQFGYINKSTYQTTFLDNLPDGKSYACAYDPDNERVYIHQPDTASLYFYNLVDGTFTEVIDSSPDLSGGLPWMEYDKSNKTLLIGKASNLGVFDPSTGLKISSLSPQGFSGSTGGGDLAMSSNNELYLAPNSGLYYFDTSQTGDNVTRKSAESLPFYITSLAIDSNDISWLATNEANSTLMNMDLITGDYVIRHVANHKINDLSDRPKDVVINCPDSDGDGVDDCTDVFPNDPESCGASFTPSQLGTGTIAFEDLWPRKGDYDFNDLVISYRVTVYLGCENSKAIKMKIDLAILAIGAGYKNGFGIELPISKDLVESVSGINLTESIINLSPNNLEVGHDNAVIIAFDNAFKNMGEPLDRMTRTNGGHEAPIKEFSIDIRFTEFIDSSFLSNAPFNPFIFVNQDRGREVHLPGHPPTALARTSLFNTGDDKTNLASNYTYKTDNGMPWALSIQHKFRVPMEKTSIDEAYSNFINFATKPNEDFSSWYSDAPGNRNHNKIYYPRDDTSLFVD